MADLGEGPFSHYFLDQIRIYYDRGAEISGFTKRNKSIALEKSHQLLETLDSPLVMALIHVQFLFERYKYILWLKLYHSTAQLYVMIILTYLWFYQSPSRHYANPYPFTIANLPYKCSLVSWIWSNQTFVRRSTAPPLETIPLLETSGRIESMGQIKSVTRGAFHPHSRVYLNTLNTTYRER